MKGINVIFSACLILAVLAISISRITREPRQREAFDRHPGSLSFTKHAICRMSCRHIDSADIREVMEHGIINFSHSDRNDRPCPTFALQGTTSSGESIRVILAQCNTVTRVVTCYNLKKEFECHCPGDEKKAREKNPY